MNEYRNFDPRNAVSRGNAFLRQQGPRLQHHIRDRIPETKVVSDWWDKLSPQMKWMYVGMAVLVATSPVSVPLFLDHMQQAGILPQDFHPTTAHHPSVHNDHNPGIPDTSQALQVEITHNPIVSDSHPVTETLAPPPKQPNTNIHAPQPTQQHQPPSEPTRVLTESYTNPAVEITTIAESSEDAFFLTIDGTGRVTGEDAKSHEDTIQQDTLGILPASTSLSAEPGVADAHSAQPIVTKEFLRNLQIRNSEFYAVNQYIFIKNLKDQTMSVYAIWTGNQGVQMRLEFERIPFSEIESFQDVFIDTPSRNTYMTDKLHQAHLTSSQLSELKAFFRKGNLAYSGFFDEALERTIALVQKGFTASELTELTNYDVDTMTILRALAQNPEWSHAETISNHKRLLELFHNHPQIPRDTVLNAAILILSQSPSVESVERVIQTVAETHEEGEYYFNELLRFSTTAIARKSLTVEALPAFLADLNSFAAGKMVPGEGGEYPLESEILYRLDLFLEKGININELFKKLTESKRKIIATYPAFANLPIEQELIQLAENQIFADPNSHSVGEIHPETVKTIAHFGFFGGEIIAVASKFGVNLSSTQTPQTILSEITRGYQQHANDAETTVADDFSSFLNRIHDWETVALKSDNYRKALVAGLDAEQSLQFIINGAGTYSLTRDQYNQRQYTSTFLTVYTHLHTFPEEEYRQLLLVKSPKDLRLYIITLGQYGQLGEEVQKNPDIFLPHIQEMVSNSDLLGMINTLHEGIQGGLKSSQSDNFQKLVIEKYQQSLKDKNTTNAAFFAFIMKANKPVFDQGFFAKYVDTETNKWPAIETPTIPDIGERKDIYAVFFFRKEDEVAEEPGGIPKVVRYFEKTDDEEYGYTKRALPQGGWELTKVVNGKTIHAIISFDQFNDVSERMKREGKPIDFMAFLQHSTNFYNFFEQANAKDADTNKMVLLAGSCNSAGQRLTLIRHGFNSPVVSYELAGRSDVSAIFSARFLDAQAKGLRGWNEIKRVEIMKRGNAMILPDDPNQNILNYALQAAATFTEKQKVASKRSGR